MSQSQKMMQDQFTANTAGADHTDPFDEKSGFATDQVTFKHD